MSKYEPDDPNIKLLEHEYDGIREYDQRLPNWWLFTLYGAIVFSIAYWLFYYFLEPENDNWSRLDQKMEVIAEAKEALAAKASGDGKLWAMSRKAKVVAAGKEIYMTSCVACHGANLEGGVGVALNDDSWIHGGKPTEVIAIVTDGVLEKGMQAWGPILGQQKIEQVVAFILSFHDEP